MKVKIVGCALKRGTDQSAGYELLAVEDIIILPNEQTLIKINVFTEIEPGYVGIVKEKSGNSLKRSIRVHAGVIDSDYRGEWGVVISNGSNVNVEIKKGQSIAQVIFLQLPIVEFEIVDKVEVSQRSGGYGSTGLGVK